MLVLISFPGHMGTLVTSFLELSMPAKPSGALLFAYANICEFLEEPKNSVIAFISSCRTTDPDSMIAQEGPCNIEVRDSSLTPQEFLDK